MGPRRRWRHAPPQALRRAHSYLLLLTQLGLNWTLLVMPHLKLQLRGLPVGSTASDVDALLAAAFPVEAMRPSLVYFEGGKVRRDKTVVAARCCVECPADAGDDEAAEGFLRVLGSCALTNAAGKCSLVQAVVSPYQKLPHADTIVDPRDNTISSDPVCEFRGSPVKSHRALYRTPLQTKSLSPSTKNCSRGCRRDLWQAQLLQTRPTLLFLLLAPHPA